MTAAQLHAVRQAYSDAFAEDLRVCAILAGVCVLVTLVTFRRNPQGVLEVRKKQVIEEQGRLKAIREAKANPEETAVSPQV
jgi:hypothetical protein